MRASKVTKHRKPFAVTAFHSALNSQRIAKNLTCKDVSTGSGA